MQLDIIFKIVEVVIIPLVVWLYLLSQKNREKIEHINSEIYKFKLEIAKDYVNVKEFIEVKKVLYETKDAVIKLTTIVQQSVNDGK